MPVNLKDEIAVDGEPVIDNTINDDRAIAGGGEGTVLAGLYHILRQLGQSGMRTEKLGNLQRRQVPHPPRQNYAII